MGVSCLAQRPAQGPISDKHYTAAELGYELVWEDQFDGDSLDSRKWAVRGVGPRGLGFVSPVDYVRVYQKRESASSPSL
jgi:hypothetical protein